MKREEKLRTKKFFVSKWIMMAMVVIGLSALNACSDDDTKYDDDIKKLEGQISGVVKDITDLKTQLEKVGGKKVANVEAATEGLKITFSDGTSTVLASYQPGKDGANGTNGKDGANGTNGKDGAAGSVVTAGEDGFWYINGTKTTNSWKGAKGETGTPGTGADLPKIEFVILDGFYAITNPVTGKIEKTNVAAPTTKVALTAVMKFDGASWSYQFGHMVDGKFVSELAIPAAGQVVTSVLFVPSIVTEDGVPVIYTATIEDKSLTKPVKIDGSIDLVYQLNPSTVLQDKFVVKGLVETVAGVVPRVSTYIVPSNTVYADGQLTLTFPSDLLKVNNSTAAANLYALVIENTKGANGEPATLVYSQYVKTHGEPIVWANTGAAGNNVNIVNKKDKVAYLANNVAGNTDLSVKFDEANGLTIEPTIVTITPANVEISPSVFSIKYEYALVAKAQHADNQYYTIDKTTGVLKVTDATKYTAIGTVALVEIKAWVVLGTIKTSTKSQRVSITTTETTATIGTIIVKDEKPQYIIGACNIVKKHAYKMNDFYSAAQMSSVNFGNSFVDQFVKVAADGTPTAATGILFDDTSVAGTVSLTVNQSVAAGNYEATRTYTAINGTKWVAKYAILLKNPGVTFDKNPSTWDGNSQIVTGLKEAGIWKMKGDIKTGFLHAGTTIVSVEPGTCGTSLGVSTVFTIVDAADRSNFTVSGSEIELINKHADYLVKNKLVKIKAVATLSNNDETPYEFTIKLVNPISIVAGPIIEFPIAADNSKLSPYSGLIIKEGTKVLTPAELKTYLVGGNITATNIIATPVSEGTFIPNERLSIDFASTITTGTGASQKTQYGNLKWSTEGIALVSPQTVAYTLKFVTSYGLTMEVKEVLKVNLKP